MYNNDKEKWEFLNINREVGQEVEFFDFEKSVKVVSPETFAVEVIKEVSSMKYFYNIEAPVMYCTNKGIIPSNLGESIALVKQGLSDLGWEVK